MMKSGTTELIFNLIRVWVHVFGTCAVFYILFWGNMLGAGDIKLMAVCVGYLGIEQGLQMFFCGFLLALIVESLRANVSGCGYPEAGRHRVRLAPYLFLGYCLFCLIL